MIIYCKLLIPDLPIFFESKVLRDRRFILPNAWAKWRLYVTTWRMYMPNVECTVTRKKIHESILVIFGIILAWILGKLRNTSWKVRAYGIYALVVFVSEIKWVSAATSTWYMKTRRTINNKSVLISWSCLGTNIFQNLAEVIKRTVSLAKLLKDI